MTRSAASLAIRLLMLALSAAALGVSIYLAYLGLSAVDEVGGCGPVARFDCEDVLTSRWAQWLGIPVGIFAAVVYTGIFVALVVLLLNVPTSIARISWTVLIGLAICAAGAAIWFVGLQLLKLDSICPFCMVVHTCGVILLALTLWAAPISRRDTDVDTLKASLVAPGGLADHPPVKLRIVSGSISALVGLAGVAVLITIQLVDQPKGFEEVTLSEPAEQPPVVGEKTKTEPEPADLAKTPVATKTKKAEPPKTKKTDDPPGVHRYLRGKVTLNAKEFPVVGSPDAPHVIVKLFDYTCPHCRRLHGYLKQARERYGDQLAIMMLPVPINPGCNRHVRESRPRHAYACVFAQMALAVWRENPQQFPKFHDWLFEPETPPEPAAARAYAEQLVGPDALVGLNRDFKIARHIRRCIYVYTDCDMGKIPKLLIGETLITPLGDPTAEQMFEQLEKLLGIKPK